MITCPNCGKDNQDHYKFCLACGTKLPAATSSRPSSQAIPAAAPAQGAPAPGQPGAPQPPNAPVAVGAPPVVGPPPGAPPAPSSATAPQAQAGDPKPCPACGFMNPDGFKFCGRCGTTLIEDPPAEAGGGGGGDVGTANTVFVEDARNLDFSQQQEPEEQTNEGMVRMPQPAAPTASAVPKAGPAPSSPTASASNRATAPVPKGIAIKLVMLGPDGKPVGERVLAEGESLEIGRASGPPWEDDAYLDPAHAQMHVTADGVELDDASSLNGVFLKLTERVEVHDGDQFRVGQELLLYEDLPEPTPTSDGTERMGSPNPGYWGRLSVLVDPEHASMAFPVEGEGIMIGRESGDITFPQDGYVSGEHCRLVGDDSGVYMEDMGSSNGTYMRVRSGSIIPFGSLILVGQKLFQVERAET